MKGFRYLFNSMSPFSKKIVYGNEWSLVWQGKQRRLEFSFASFSSLKKVRGLGTPDGFVAGVFLEMSI
jgi:hypothetical protein